MGFSFYYALMVKKLKGSDGWEFRSFEIEIEIEIEKEERD